MLDPIERVVNVFTERSPDDVSPFMDEGFTGFVFLQFVPNENPVPCRVVEWNRGARVVLLHRDAIDPRRKHGRAFRGESAAQASEELHTSLSP
jgi:hypothetical protein